MSNSLQTVQEESLVSPTIATKRFKLDSTAPHVCPASRYTQGQKDWGIQADMLEGESKSSGTLLWKDGKGAECGIWDCTPGRWRLTLPADELCHFLFGRATYTSDQGEVIEVSSGTVVHFKQGWQGECQVHDTIRNVYMLVT